MRTFDELFTPEKVERMRKLMYPPKAISQSHNQKIVEIFPTRPIDGFGSEEIPDEYLTKIGRLLFDYEPKKTTEDLNYLFI